MPRSKSSRRWLDRQFQDPYVKQAQAKGYRSRAAFKLLEIQEKDRILTKGKRVVDLGAAPGSWSQIASTLVGPGGLVVALDLLAIDPIPGVVLLQGDFREQPALDALRSVLGEEALDVVLSDMAPNTSGITAVDQPRAMYLAELALDFAEQTLKPGGVLVVKCFQGAGFDELLRNLRARFARVASRKPQASRRESREVYLVAQGFRGDSDDANLPLNSRCDTTGVG
jgi:23S rRNA (uridine2552-2'-O)-methyltransferase